ncbi:hypothetical protein OAP69_03560 [Hellea sp.]|nr:hypothetical protein [Hellea sp.]
MQSFSGISFLWATFLLAILGTIYAFAYFLLTHKVSKDAESDYLYKTKNGMIDKSINKEDYINLFIQQHKPRKFLYIATGSFSILILTWPIMAIISYFLECLYQFTGRNRVFEPGFLVWQFCIFFGIILSWASLAYLIVTLYYKRAPNSLVFKKSEKK